MTKCLDCDRELLAEYDSQICLICAGEDTSAGAGRPCETGPRIFSGALSARIRMIRARIRWPVRGQV